MSLDTVARRRLAALETEDLLREPRVADSSQGPEIDVDGRRVVCLCSNNYLGLADHPRLLQATKEAIDRYGVGSGASRLVSGSMTPHRLAETSLARFVGAEDALLFSTGYAANVGTIQGLVGRSQQAAERIGELLPEPGQAPADVRQSSE